MTVHTTPDPDYIMLEIRVPTGERELREALVGAAKSIHELCLSDSGAVVGDRVNITRYAHESKSPSHDRAVEKKITSVTADLKAIKASIERLGRKYTIDVEYDKVCAESAKAFDAERAERVQAGASKLVARLESNVGSAIIEG